VDMRLAYAGVHRDKQAAPVLPKNRTSRVPDAAFGCFGNGRS
jgi:hypothetical protein